jgi:hypothetical protein
VANDTSPDREQRQHRHCLALFALLLAAGAHVDARLTQISFPRFELG